MDTSTENGTDNQQQDVAPAEAFAEQEQGQTEQGETQEQSSEEQEDNLFGDTEEEKDYVPLKKHLDQKAKLKHRLNQAEQQAQELRKQNEYIMQQINAATQQQGQSAGSTAYSPDQIANIVEQRSQEKIVEQKIHDIVSPGLKKYGDFADVVGEVKDYWTNGMILATKDLPDSADFIYQMSKKYPGKVQEIAMASTPEERGELMGEWKLKWKKANLNKSANKKVITKVDAAPTKTLSSHASVSKISESSRDAFRRNTGRYRQKS